MLDHTLKIALWIAFTLTVTIALINAFYMLVSPVAWFALPKWLRLQGVLGVERYGTGTGALQLRILGGIIVATIIWIGLRLLVPASQN